MSPRTLAAKLTFLMKNGRSKQLLFLKTLVERYHSGKELELLRYWNAPTSVAAFNQIAIAKGTPQELLILPKKALEAIHYSWLAEAMEQLPPLLHLPIIASLGEEQKESLCHHKKIHKAQLPPSPAVIQPFLHALLYRKVEGNDQVFPLAFSPIYPLSKLITLDKNLLLEIFDLLGLYDLAVKTKRIINKKTLDAIYQSLTPLRKKIFHIFLQSGDKARLPEIDLTGWTGDSRILKKMLHRRGILRLSHALAGYSQDFIWHFCRRLDTGRGRIVLRFYSETATPFAEPLAEQVQFIINMLTKKSESTS